MAQVQTMACGSCTIENGLKAMFIAHEVPVYSSLVSLNDISKSKKPSDNGRRAFIEPLNG